MLNQVSILTGGEPLRHRKTQVLFWKQTNGIKVSVETQPSFSMFEWKDRMKKAICYTTSSKTLAVSGFQSDYVSDFSLFSALFSVFPFSSVRQVAHDVNTTVGGMTQ